MSEIKTTKFGAHARPLLINGLIGLVVALGLLLEARNLAVNYPIVWSVSSMSYWYWVAHYAGISVLVISVLLVVAYVTVVFFSDQSE
jgi:hypothetical protein